MNPFQIEENIFSIKNGNIFKAETTAIVNPVNCVGVSGAGLALKFKQKYPDNYEAYKAYCETGFLIIGECFSFNLECKSFPQWIINFPSKLHFRDPSKIEYIEKGLDGMITDMQIYRIKSVSIPKIGCGKGGLDWNIVKPLIVEKLKKYHKHQFYLYE